MKLEQASYSVDSVIQLKESVHDYLKQNESEETSTVSSDKILGGVLSSVRHSWLACGPRLEVLDTHSGSKIAAWVFRAAHEFETAVTCVTELPAQRGNTPLLVVGLECEITGGMICVFDVGSSRVVRAVQIDEKVTNVEVVSSGCDSGLPGVLNALDGVIAVGTAKGKVLLIDLCRQICEEGITNSTYETIRDEINPCHLIHLEFDDLRNLESHKEISLNKGDHLCLQLNEKSTSGPHFSLYGPTGDLRLRANLSEVAISSLHFTPALGSLLVGFNFGCWSLYNLLSGPALDYTSPMYDDCLPVNGFAVQEPCDDPRAFLYVWVSYSSEQVDIATMVVMYALTYESKDCLEGYGCLYQDLGNCSVRFQIDFGKLVLNRSARCLSMRSYNRQVSLEVPEERLTFCCIIWAYLDSSTNILQTHLTIFDLNQWYKEQMPYEPHSNFSHYMSCINITQLLSLNSTNFQILDLRLDSNSLSPFTCPLRLEEHYQPSALGLRGLALGPGQAAWVRSSGAQRHLLQQLDIAGPLSLLQPQELYQRAISLGLCPQYQDVVGGPTVKQMRWHILSVALEHQLVRWLCRCARDWSSGAQSISGCTLDFLLEWAWQRASTLKFNCDKMCVPLFDHTGQRLDHNALLQLNHASCQLKHLATLFETVLQVCRVCFSNQDLEDINYQYTSLQMLSTYLEVLQWLLNVGLLPERPLSMYPLLDSSILSAPYPVETLSKFYQSRRSDLSEPLLFIDQLISRELGGEALTRQWRSDGGDGNYPPPSLQSLLRTYLLEDVELVHKHCLFIYVFLDLAMILDEGRYKTTVTHLIKFPAVFKMGAGVIKVTQAMWQLDHGDFSTAMAQLLDPAVGTEDLKGWQHRLVLKALLLQGQHQHALLYHQVRKPPVSSVQDICIVITLLIVNDLLQEAFHFQRQNRSVYNEKEILKHFFTVCDKMSQLQTILQLPLSPSEESAFISYLQQHSSDLHEHLQVIYYLQRDRYEEAFHTNDKLNAKVTEYRQGLLGQQDRNLRNVVVQGFKKTLPDVTQTLLDAVKKDKERMNKWRNVDRPVPMSVMVHDSKEQAKYKSTLIQASFHKAKETWTWLKDNKNETPFISTPKTPLMDTRNEPTLIYASAMHLDVPNGGDGDYAATPAKRMKLSPRQSISAQNRAPRLSAGQSPHSLSLLDTPIVKRKSYRNQDLNSNESPVPSVVGTPTSILKVRSLLRKTSISPDIGNGDERGTSTTPEVLEEEMDQDVESGVTPLDQSTANAIKSAVITISSTSFTSQRRRSSLGVSARRPIQRTPRPAVHFEEADRPSSRSSDGSTSEPPSTTTNLQVRCEVHREQTPDTAPSSKDSSKSNDDIFYSPNESFNDAQNQNQMDIDEKEQTKEDIKEDTGEERRNLKRKLNHSPVKSRRSYKSGTTVKIQVEKPVEKEETAVNSSPIKSISSLSSPRRSLRSSKTQETPKITIIPPEQTEQESSSKKEESSPRREIFPKLGARRSLSRQVLEQNTIRALQQPLIQTRLSMSKPSSVEVSYSKTVTSIVKKSSDSSIEETCDKSTVEMKNIFTTEKNSSSTPVFKHIHNESSSKSSVRKLTEVLDEETENKEGKTLSEENSFTSACSERILSSSSSVEDSILQNWNKERSILSSTTGSEAMEEEKENNKESEPEDINMEETNKQLEEAKKNKVLNETVFEDISTIIDEDEISSEESEVEEMETEDHPTKEDSQDSISSNVTEKRISVEKEELPQKEEEAISIQDEDSRTSSSEKISNQSELSEDNLNIEEVSQNTHEESVASIATSEENEDKETEVEEEKENYLVPSSEEDSNQDEEVMFEEVEQEEEEILESEEQSDESAVSSRSSDVIEIKSSDEESMEELKLNQTIDPEENQEEECENEEIEEEEHVENNLDQMIKEVDQEIEDIEKSIEAANAENLLKRNVKTLEQIVKENASQEETRQQQIEDNVEENEIPVEICSEKEETDVEVNQMEERINEEITSSQPVEVEEKQVASEIMEVEQEIEVQIEEEIDIPEDIQQEIEENMQEEEQEKKSTPKVQTKQTYTVASQDCLETMNLTENQQQVQVLEQTDILCDENLAQIPEQIFEEKIEENVPTQDITIGNNPAEPKSSYTPSRRSKRINSKQEPSKIEEPVSSGIQTRRRSMSVDIEEKKEVPKSPARSTRNRRSISVDVDVKKIEETPRITRARSEAKEELKPVPRTRKPSTDTEPKEEKLARISTRKRSTSIDVEAKEETSKRTPPDATAKEEKPTRVSTRKQSLSTDVEAKEETTKPTPPDTTTKEEKPIRISTRTRSTSIDEAREETLKPSPRTRKRSNSVDVEENKPLSLRRKRSTSVDAEEEIPKRSTRASSVVSLPPIIEETRKTRTSSQEPEEETKRKTRASSQEHQLVTSPSRRGRKRSIQAEIIPEEPEDNSEEIKKALEDIPDKIEEYSSTHRLTRRQKLIMEKSLEQQELKKLENKFNPPKHIRKVSPGGPQEVEEHNRSISPSSSVSSTPSRRARRRDSHGSSTPSTPRRSTRTTRTQSIDTQDDVSSVRSVPVVRLDRNEIERHRSLSPTALKKSPKGKKKGSRKSILPETELSKISEEASTAPALDAAPSTPKSRRQRGRPKKTELEDSEQQPSQSTDSTSSVPLRKTASYRPLEGYAPKFSAFKTRRSFKVKK